MEDRYQALTEAYNRLRQNRAKIPLHVLKKKYGKAYNALLFELKGHIDWFVDDLINQVCRKDIFSTEQNQTLDNEIQRIKEEARNNGTYAKAYHLLLIDLNEFEFIESLNPIFERVDEVYSKYWNAHCKWAGPPENRWIYNSITNQYWFPATSKFWTDWDGGNPFGFRPPSIGPDPMTLHA